MSARESGMIVEEISAYVHANAGGWAGGLRPLSDSPEIIARPWSFMLRYPVQDGHAILVKIARQNEMDIEEAVESEALRKDSEKDFRMLSKIAEIFQSKNGSFCFVQPYAYLPQWNAFAMEELAIYPLKNDFLRARMFLGLERDWAAFCRLLQNAAVWLQIFHAGAGGLKIIPLAETNTKARLDEVCRKTGFDCVELRTEYERLAQRSVPVTALHGDFHCGNIFVNERGQVGAFDADILHGPVYIDLAKLFADMETRFVQMLLQGNFMRAAQRRRVYQTLLEGYAGANEILFEEDVFLFFIKVAILEEWAVDERTPKSKAKSLLHNATSKLRERYFLQLLKDERRWVC